MRIVDAWIQHPTLRLANHEMFESLRRWIGVEGQLDRPIPLEVTISAMDEAGVGLALSSAWYGPAGSLIDNDEVAEAVERFPDRLRGVAGVDLGKPV